MKHPLAAVVCIALATQLTSQTFIVDATGAPGSSFTDLPDAIAAVPSGAVLLVRPGSYSPFTIDAKALTVVGEAGAEVVADPPGHVITIQNTAATQRVTVRGIAFRYPGSASLVAYLAGCMGPVSLANLQVVAATGAHCRVEAHGCNQILLDSCELTQSFGPGLYLSNCADAVCINSNATTSLGDAVVASNSKLHLINCHAAGGMALTYQTGAAVLLADAELRLSGNCQLERGPSLSARAVHIGVGGSTASMRRSPGSVLTGGVSSGVVETALPECALTVTGGDLGTSVTATLQGTNGHLGALLFGSPAQSIAVPGFEDTIWLDPTNIVTTALAVFGAPLQTAVPIPSNPVLLGSAFAWQGITFESSTGLLASNPGWFVIE